jgi:hypothetical protein
MMSSRLETRMHFSERLSDWDTVLLMVPFLAAMALGMFGLDEKFVATAKQHPSTRRSFCGIAPDGRFCLRDPDGKPSADEPSDRSVKTLGTVTAAGGMRARPMRASLLRRGVQI